MYICNMKSRRIIANNTVNSKLLYTKCGHSYLRTCKGDNGHPILILSCQSPVPIAPLRL